MEPSNIVKENIKDLNDKLIAAVKASDIKTVEDLLDSGADAGYMNFTGFSPVYYACAKGNVEMLRVLVSRGADVNADCYRYKRKPLHIASQYNHLEVVKYLLEAKAKVTAVDGRNATALHEVYSEKVAKLLLKHGCDTEIMDSNGMTALHWACDRDLLPVVRTLVHYGAKIDQTCSRMYTPLHYAVIQRSEDIVRFLLENKTNVNLKNKLGETPLHLACQLLAVGVIKMVLAHEADVNCPDMEGKTALHYICDSKMEESIDHNTEREDGLSYPSEKMRCEIIKLLLQKGTSINSKCKKMMTPLHYAAKKGYSGIIKLLLEKGADPNSRSQFGMTALHMAYMQGYASVVKVMVESNADVNAICWEKWKTPLAYAGNIRDNLTHIYEGTDCGLCRELLERQIIKLGSVNNYVCKDNITLVSSSESVREFLDSCENEVFKLKNHFLYNKIYFYDFLTKNETQLAIYTKNVNVMRAIKELQIRDIYPIYGDMIEENIKKGQRRLTLLKEGEKCLIELLNYNLPLLFVSDVLTYLGNEDLHNLVASCKPDNELI